jgi:hypothetical protein
MLKRFLILCVLALAIGAAAGFAMPADAAGTTTLQHSP